MLWKKLPYCPHLMSPETRQEVAPAHGPHSAGLSGSGFFEASNKDEDAKGAGALTQAPLAHVQHDLAAASLQRVAYLLVANLGRLIHVGHGTVVDLEVTESNQSRLA